MIISYILSNTMKKGDIFFEYQMDDNYTTRKNSCRFLWRIIYTLKRLSYKDSLLFFAFDEIMVSKLYLV
jgi:hypothetical protein